jgi:hypothetical protein
MEIEKEITVEEAFLELKNESYLKGIHLMERPFIPEEIGFVETPITNANGSTIAIVYSREGFNISLPINGEERIWSIITPYENSTIKTEILSMFEGLLILSALGMKGVHPFEFVKKSIESEF